jgi:hypothetical protein
MVRFPFKGQSNDQPVRVTDNTLTMTGSEPSGEGSGEGTSLRVCADTNFLKAIIE